MRAVVAGLRRAPDRLLTAAAVLGGLVLVVVGCCVALGVRPVVLTSGSMAPTMPTGTLALMREVSASSVAVGDVVCVRTASGQRVTHRVIGVEAAGSATVLTLQGDANRTPDPQPYAGTDVYRLIGSVPQAGYLLGRASSPTGLLALGALAAGLLTLIARGGPGERPRPRGTRRAGGGRRRVERRAARGTVRGTAVGAAAAVLAAGPAAQAAPWTDTTSIGGTTLTAVTVPAPATFTCGGLGVLSVTFNWSAVAGASSYTLHYGNGGAQTATIAGTSATVVSAISGGTAWVVANRAYGSTTWSSVASTTRSYTVAVVSLCS